MGCYSNNLPLDSNQVKKTKTKIGKVNQLEMAMNLDTVCISEGLLCMVSMPS